MSQENKKLIIQGLPPNKLSDSISYLDLTPGPDVSNYLKFRQIKETTMLKTKLVLLILFILCGSAYGVDTKPSDQSIKELMRVADSHKMLDSMMGQYDAVMKSNMRQALEGENITPERQKQLDDMLHEITLTFKQELSWEKLEPLFVKIYRDSFSQEEVDGMLAFYKSPSGQAVIHKMPLVMQNTMTEMQKLMGPALQKVVQKAKNTIETMKPDTPKNQ